VGELVEAVKALSAPATKLIEVVSRGIGRAYDPRYKKRMADATVYEMDVISDAARRNIDLPIIIDRNGVQLDARSAQELAQRAQMRLFSQEMRKQQNIEAIVDKAYEDLQNETEASSEPIDDDWIVRFFNCVEDVSNGKLQEIWGKILAGEIRKPGCSSLRTLDTLKNISYSEACLFEKISVCAFYTRERVIIPHVKKTWEMFDIRIEDLLTLDGAGIINLADLSMTVLAGTGSMSIRNSQIIGLISNHQENSKPLTISVYCLTDTGKEILSVITPAIERSELFALEFFKVLKATYSEFQIQAFRIIKIFGNKTQYETTDLL